MEPTAIQQAVALAGGQAHLAKALGVTPGLVSQWVNGRRNVAPNHCPAIEGLTGVKCEQLRPDLDWRRNRNGSVTSYCVAVNNKKTG